MRDKDRGQLTGDAHRDAVDRAYAYAPASHGFSRDLDGRARLRHHADEDRVGVERAVVSAFDDLEREARLAREVKGVAHALADEAGLSFSFETGDDADADHPNTVDILLRGGGRETLLRGESLGGGRVRISRVNGVAVELTGDYPTLFVAHKDVPWVLATLTTLIADSGANIATMRTFRSARGADAYSIFELDAGIPAGLTDELSRADNVDSITVVEIPGAAIAADGVTLTHPFSNGEELLYACRASGLGIGGLMRERELELMPGRDADAEMARVLATMRAEVKATLRAPEPSLGGFLDGQAKRVADEQARLAAPLLGASLTRASAYAMAVIERSAAMGAIVAAPTAGSAGVVPGALLATAEELGADEDALTRSLWNAAAIGALIASNASVSGAEGGCQAEVGTASAMAASALTELMGGAPEDCLAAAGIAIANMLGLVCDPVQGLVEYPCQLRNASGAACAMSAAQLALSGVAGPLPFDEVVDAMKRVGESLPASLRETALGGLAAAPSACQVCRSCN